MLHSQHYLCFHNNYSLVSLFQQNHFTKTNKAKSHSPSFNKQIQYSVHIQNNRCKLLVLKNYHQQRHLRGRGVTIKQPAQHVVIVMYCYQLVTHMVAKLRRTSIDGVTSSYFKLTHVSMTGPGWNFIMQLQVVDAAKVISNASVRAIHADRFLPRTQNRIKGDRIWS